MRNTSKDSILFQTRKEVKSLVQIVKLGAKTEQKPTTIHLLNGKQNSHLVMRCRVVWPASKGLLHLFWLSICSDWKLKLHNTDDKRRSQSGTLTPPRSLFWLSHPQLRGPRAVGSAAAPFQWRWAAPGPLNEAKTLPLNACGELIIQNYSVYSKRYISMKQCVSQGRNLHAKHVS